MGKTNSREHCSLKRELTLRGKNHRGSSHWDMQKGPLLAWSEDKVNHMFQTHLMEMEISCWVWRSQIKPTSSIHHILSQNLDANFEGFWGLHWLMSQIFLTVSITCWLKKRIVVSFYGIGWPSSHELYFWGWAMPKILLQIEDKARIFFLQDW